MNFKRLLSVAAAAALSVSVSAQSLRSPDGNLELRFAIAEGGVPTYSLSYGDKTVVRPSALGFEFVEDA